MRIDESITINAVPSCVWEHVADPSGYAEWMEGVTRFDPADARRAPARGARYAMLMKVGSVEVGGVVEITEFEVCKDLAWHSVSGLDQRGRIRLREIQRGCTRATLRLSYQTPGGVWGLIADRLSGVAVRRSVVQTLETLRERCVPDTEAGESRRPDPVAFLRSQLMAARVLADAGVLRPSRPDRLVAAALALQRWGLTIPGGFIASASRYPEAVAVIDDHEQVTFAELDRRSNAIANGLYGIGIREGDRVGLLCRNHARFAESLIALSKLGADVLLLNTGLAAPELRDVLHREAADAVIHDGEFTQTIGDAVARKRRIVAWTETGRTNATTLLKLRDTADSSEPRPPERPSKITILTSGTTGAPKGASRSQPNSADPIVGILSRIPLRSGGTTLMAAPLFHAWGLAHLGLAIVLSSTLVLQRRFDPEETLAAVQREQADALIAIPVMLHRILELPKRVRSRYDTSSLRVVAVSGSALPVQLADAFMGEYGDILYNLYGSTEVAAAAIATPEDMREAPGTVGRPPFGTVVRLLDERGHDVSSGGTGRIFVGNDLLFEGYTQGESGTSVDGLVSTGDMGCFDDEGRLFIVGRSDDMIVSGGENVYPREIEELLLQHPGVNDVAVVGVSDDEWGQRLSAFVVRRGRLSEGEVKRHVRAHLARYKVPRDVQFVDQIPRSATGKVVKAELARTPS
ncbi:MAG: AMP-binding protein [Candidatus Dormibacteria bacterium]